MSCRNDKPAVGVNWTVQQPAKAPGQAPAQAPVARKFLTAPAVAPAPALSSASAPAPAASVVAVPVAAASGAQQLVGMVTSVSGGQPTVPKQQPASQLGSAKQQSAPVLPDGAAYTASDGQASTAATPPAVSATPDQAQLASATSATLSKDLSNSPNTPDRFYSAAVAATAYVSESGTSPALSPGHKPTVPGVSNFGQMLGGRRR